MVLLKKILAEFRESPRLRWGAISIVVIFWVYALLSLKEDASVRREAVVQLQEEIERLEPFEKGRAWIERAEEVRSRRVALEALLYASTRSQAEAAFRDWLQTVAQGSNIKLNELSVKASDLDSSGGEGAEHLTTAQLKPDGEAVKPDYETLRARLAFDFKPETLTSLLLLFRDNAKVVLVDRLLIRNRVGQPSQAGQVEMDLRALNVVTEPKP